MNWTATLTILGVASIVALISRIVMKRERPLGHVSHIPWTWIMIIAVLIALLMIVHIANMLGIETGPGARPGLR